jgi:hypothetical protein
LLLLPKLRHPVLDPPRYDQRVPGRDGTGHAIPAHHAENGSVFCIIMLLLLLLGIVTDLLLLPSLVLLEVPDEGLRGAGTRVPRQRQCLHRSPDALNELSALGRVRLQLIPRTAVVRGPPDVGGRRKVVAVADHRCCCGVGVQHRLACCSFACQSIKPCCCLVFVLREKRDRF